MIYYFSGSGNSRALALELGELLHEAVQKAGSGRIIAQDSLGFVFPVYSWGIPPLLLRWIASLQLSDVKPRYVWALLDYGDEAGYAGRMIRKALMKRALPLDALFGIQMPNTYVLLPGFDVDSPLVAGRKLNEYPPRLRNIAAIIKSRQRNVEDIHVGPMPGLKSGMVFPLFKKMGIFPSRWHVDTSKCTGCGLCAGACPVENIAMADNHPAWGKQCTSCLGCYHACPHHAVRYGTTTRNKGQWRHWFIHPYKKHD